MAPGAPLLVTVGRADATKDLGGLFEALARVRAVRPDASLVLVGADPEDLGSLDLEPPPGVAAIGWQDRPADYLAAADAVVIPSWTEGHSNVADEALMLGRPVVTTDAGAHPPIVREAGGRVVPIRRPDALGEAILDVLASPPSSDAVRSVAERCLGMDGVLDATMAVYERVLGS